jgi:hypothetical protein
LIIAPFPGATFVPVKDAESADSQSKLVKRGARIDAAPVEPPSRVGELISWLTEAGKDDVRYLVLEHPN